MSEVKLFISVPSNRDWKGRFGASLAGLMSRLTNPGIQVEGYQLKSFFLRAWGQASCLSIVRQKFVDEIIAEGFTHWLALDDDMTFPMDIVDQLIRHNKPIVSCNARHKHEEVKGTLLDVNGQTVDSTGRTGLQEIKAMGGAIFLAQVDSFKHIPRPHFQVLWLEDRKEYLSEDMYFALLLNNNGVKMYCDHDASQHIGHIGDHEYKFPEVKKAG